MVNSASLRFLSSDQAKEEGGGNKQLQTNPITKPLCRFAAMVVIFLAIVPDLPIM